MALLARLAYLARGLACSAPSHSLSPAPARIPYPRLRVANEPFSRSRFFSNTMADSSATKTQDNAGTDAAGKPRVAIIICSTRNPRVCPQVAKFVHETYTMHANSVGLDASIVDLADWPLPFLDEPRMASVTHRTEDYAYEHTRRWSAEIAQYQGFVWVLPQYNWGYPAVVKNAVDFLFHEWKGKSALIVTYGGRGGGKSASAFRQVLDGIGMHATESQPQFHLHRDDFVAIPKGEPIGVTGPDSKWNEHREALVKGFKELETLIKEHSVEKL